MKSTLVIAATFAAAVSAVPTVVPASSVEQFGGSLDSVKDKPDALAAFRAANVLNLLPDGTVGRRQAVPVDGTPDPDRNITTPENVFVLQCGTAGFRDTCLVFGAPPGKCGTY